MYTRIEFNQYWIDRYGLDDDDIAQLQIGKMYSKLDFLKYLAAKPIVDEDLNLHLLWVSDLNESFDEKYVDPLTFNVDCKPIIVEIGRHLRLAHIPPKKYRKRCPIPPVP